MVVTTFGIQYAGISLARHRTVLFEDFDRAVVLSALIDRSVAKLAQVATGFFDVLPIHDPHLGQFDFVAGDAFGFALEV